MITRARLFLGRLREHRSMRTVRRMRLVDRGLVQARGQGRACPLNLQQTALSLRRGAAGRPGAQGSRPRGRTGAWPRRLPRALVAGRFLVRPCRKDIGKAVGARRGPRRILQPARCSHNAHDHDGLPSVS